MPESRHSQEEKKSAETAQEEREEKKEIKLPVRKVERRNGGRLPKKFRPTWKKKKGEKKEGEGPNWGGKKGGSPAEKKGSTPRICHQGEGGKKKGFPRKRKQGFGYVLEKTLLCEKKGGRKKEVKCLLAKGKSHESRRGRKKKRIPY